MDEFDIFDREKHDQNLELAKLLYRAGAWVSAMDGDGGISSVALEKDAMLNTLRAFIKDNRAKEYNQVFQTVIDHFLAWDTWSKNLASFPAEVQIQSSSLTLEYKNAMFDLAQSVAIRFRERGALNAFWAGMFKSLKNFISPNEESLDMNKYLNISKSEKYALNELADLLQLPNRYIL